MTLTWSAVVGVQQLPFGRLFRRLDRPVPNDAEIVTAYTDGQVTLRSNRTKIGYHEAANLSGFQGVVAGDFVVHGLDILRGSVGISDSSGAMSSVCSVCEPTGPVDPRFVAHVIRVQARSGFTKALARGIREGGADFRRWATLAELPIPVPSLDYQKRVCDYLDRETARIDTLIEEQQRLIDLLRERRRSVISDLLGDRVGEGTRLKWFFNELDRRAGAEADTLPLMSVSISWGIRRRDEVIQDESRAEDLSNYKVCRQGDLVINRMRAFQGALGLAQEDGLVSPDYAVLRAKPKVSGEWLAAVMKSGAFVSEMSQRVKGIGSTDLGSARTPRINIADLGEIRIDLPEVEQQVFEAGQLHAQTAKIDALIMETERFIELARERRAALITAAVTGQIDVREAV